MRIANKVLTVSYLFIMLLTMSADASLFSQKQSALGKSKQAAESEGVQLKLRVANDYAKKTTSGKPIVLVATIKNVTNQQRFLYRTNFLLDYTIEVRDKAGRKVGLTESGVRRYERAGLYYSRELVNLQPQRVYEVQADISGLYDMTAGNTYYITLKRRIARPVLEETAEVVSNMVEVKL
ncbi:MAG: hypothetical protein MSG64_07600 [Pyrinomonadaceae bacterium MAG19_C2-C3]|nr:hypothetical protein [Pyrinomonadaceae bacterium MAG19_C2-C3]